MALTRQTHRSPWLAFGAAGSIEQDFARATRKHDPGRQWRGLHDNAKRRACNHSSPVRRTGRGPERPESGWSNSNRLERRPGSASALLYFRQPQTGPALRSWRSRASLLWACLRLECVYEVRGDSYCTKLNAPPAQPDTRCRKGVNTRLVKLIQLTQVFLRALIRHKIPVATSPLALLQRLERIDIEANLTKLQHAHSEVRQVNEKEVVAVRSEALRPKASRSVPFPRLKLSALQSFSPLIHGQ